MSKTFFNKKKILAIHDGEFHSDDLFVAAIIKLICKEKIKIIRTRDENIIKKADFVADVGGEYDEKKNRFDHHQIGGAGQRENGIPYASFGLVWKKYGKKLCGSLKCAEIIDQKLVAPVDAGDNGVSVYREAGFTNISPYLIEYFFFLFRPTYKEENKNLDKDFNKALKIAEFIIQREIKINNDILKAEKIIVDFYKKSKDKRLIILDFKYPWKYVLMKYPEPLFVVCPDEGRWKLSAVKKNITTFENRKDLPKIWAGKRNEEFQKVTGVSDAIFCHNKKFLAVAKTKEGILKLASIALNETNEVKN